LSFLNFSLMLLLTSFIESSLFLLLGSELCDVTVLEHPEDVQPNVLYMK